MLSVGRLIDITTWRRIDGGIRTRDLSITKSSGVAQRRKILVTSKDVAGVAGQCERNHGNVGMYHLRPKPNGFGLFNASLRLSA